MVLRFLLEVGAVFASVLELGFDSQFRTRCIEADDTVCGESQTLPQSKPQQGKVKVIVAGVVDGEELREQPLDVFCCFIHFIVVFDLAWL